MTAIDFKQVFDRSPNPYMLVDRQLRYVAANDAYLKVTASRLEDLLGRSVFDVFPDDPDDPNRHSVQMLRESLEAVLREGRQHTLALISYKVPRTSARGAVLEDRDWSATHTPIFGEAGNVLFVMQHTVDVTEFRQLRRLARAAAGAETPVPSAQIEAGVLERAQLVQTVNTSLEAEREHLHHLFKQAPGMICVLRGDQHVFEIVNEAFCTFIGRRDFIGQSVRDVLPEVVEQGLIALLDQALASGEPYTGRQTPVLLERDPNAGPEKVFIDFVFQPTVGHDGKISGIFLQGSDVTAQVRAEEELRSYRDHLEELVRNRTQALKESEDERQHTEAALHQAQKMESIGKLTGGIAHDFNNLLQVIHGNLQLMENSLSNNTLAQQRLKIATDAVERGARLASQLLAFGRRQPLEPVVTHLGRLVRNMSDMLHHSLGERIELETVVGDNLWNTLVDPNQIENALLNLVINARDAMDGEGKLVILADNVLLDDDYVSQHSELDSGQYVMLSISDTGRGIAPELIERVFEPFFTTKGKTHGTGLGLSMVYGLIKQSEGHIEIFSELGKGTTIKLYLPRTLSAQVQDPEVLTGPVEGGTETILVVEDDSQVRELAVATLSELGYRVLKATDGLSALAVLQSGVPIDLLFTDVVMPGAVRSPQLAEQAKVLLPDIDVLFTSGYTENAIVHGGRLDPGVQLLSKPYRREDLARKIRHILHNREQRLSARTHESTALRPLGGPAAIEVLLVEDDLDVRQLASDYMEGLGCMVAAAATAEAALEALATQQFDVLFSDITLPGMSGLELAIEAQRQHSKLRVVLSSGNGDLRPKPLTPGAADWLYLPKPYGLKDLEKVLTQVMVSQDG